MPVCSFAPHQTMGTTVLDNAFIEHFLPYAGESALKVYLYGLSLCQTPLAENNNLQSICLGLDMSAEVVVAAFDYWESMGLVRVASREPLLVQYLSPSKAMEPNKLIAKDKYGDFLLQLQDVFQSRQMSSNELFQYLQFLEDTHLEPQALVMIAKFCADRKGENIRAAYVLTVARNWIQEGCTTLADTEARILDADSVSEEVRAVFHALHKRSAPDIDDRQLYLKWTRSWGFAPAAILRAAKTVKRGGMARLDAVLDGFFRSGVFSEQDIEAYLKTKDDTIALCISINKILGLYYESLEYLVETYTTPWLQLGYSANSLVQLAKYCSMRGIRTLEGMHNVVQDCYRQGIVDDTSVAVFLDEYATVEKQVARIINATGSTRRPTENDRDLYRTWRNTWGFDDNVILYAAGLAQGKPYPMANMGHLLSRWHNDGLYDLARIQSTTTAAATITPAATVDSHAGEEFRRAEIRAELERDAEYRKAAQRVRTLTMQAAHCEIDGTPIPLTLQEDLRQAQEELQARVRQLGFAPEDI